MLVKFFKANNLFRQTTFLFPFAGQLIGFLNRKVKVGSTLRWNAIQQAGTCKHFHLSSQKSAGTPLCVSRVGLGRQQGFSGAHQGDKPDQ